MCKQSVRLICNGYLSCLHITYNVHVDPIFKPLANAPENISKMKRNV